jgi:hypothetical protein
MLLCTGEHDSPPAPLLPNGLPPLPDLEHLFECAVPAVDRNFVAMATNKLLQHSPYNPVDAGLTLRSNFIRTQTHRDFNGYAHRQLRAELDHYFECASKIPGFHMFMISSGSQVHAGVHRVAGGRWGWVRHAEGRRQTVKREVAVQASQCEGEGRASQREDCARGRVGLAAYPLLMSAARVLVLPHICRPG